MPPELHGAGQIATLNRSDATLRRLYAVTIASSMISRLASDLSIQQMAILADTLLS